MTIHLIYLLSLEFEHIIKILSVKSLKLFLLFLHISERILTSMVVLNDF